MTSQLPPTTRQPSSEDDIRKYTVGELKPHDAPVRLVDYDPAWPGLFEREAARIRGVLAERVLELEHTGSTSVPGLAAKPCIDMTLVIPDSSDEPSYVPDLEAAGYTPGDPRARLVRTSGLQGPRHERESPRLLARLPGTGSDGRLPRLAADP